MIVPNTTPRFIPATLGGWVTTLRPRHARSRALVIALLFDFADLGNGVVDVLLTQAPACRVPGLDPRTVELIYFFEGEALGLGDEEVDVYETEYEHAEEDEEDERPDVLGDARREEGQEEIPEPVCVRG